MKRPLIYLLLFAATAGIAATVILKEHKKADIFLPIKDRVPKLAGSEEWKITKKNADDLYQKLLLHPEDQKTKMQLAELYIQEARVTGDHVYYDKAAMQLLNDVLKKDSVNFEAMVCKSVLYLSQHHFADGLAIANKAKNLNPYNAYVYGLLTDADVELGNYKEAVDMADKMSSVRPDIRSYSRVSYLREIYGDYPGAIDAMKLAVTAGYPGMEQTEWARVQLGHLYEYSGDLKDAEMQYRLALDERPDYAYAYAGLGRIARAHNNLDEAISDFEKADGLVEDYSFKDELIDLYAAKGDKSKSEKTAGAVLDQLNAAAQSGNSDASIGHYADKELANVYVKTGNYSKALEHAQLEYNRRPDNIDVNETLAWVYYRNGDLKNALTYIQPALRTESKNPVLLSQAAIIYYKTGNIDKAKQLRDAALINNANFSPELKQELVNTVGGTIAGK